MDDIRKHAEAGTLHHAYLIEGDYTVIYRDLLVLLENSLRIQVQANPDVHVQTTEQFGIGDARSLMHISTTKPMNGEYTIIVLGFDVATPEAQNALLKTLEEPTSSTHFFIITPNAENLLPTVRSRMHLVQTGTHLVVDPALVSKYLSETGAGRLGLIKRIIESKNAALANAFLGEVELALRKKNNIRSLTINTAIFVELQQARTMLEQRSSSVKMIMEHISNVIPRGGFLQ